MNHIEQEHSILTADKEYQLSLKPDGFNGKYGCMISFEDEKSKTELRYKLTIHFLKKTSEFTNSFRISRLPEFYINDREPENFLDILAHEVSSILYPLDIETHKKGTIHKVLNYQGIVVRWNQKKKQLLEKYKGELINKYIRLTEHTLASEEGFLNKISKDWFIQLYFAPLYTNYDHNYSFESQIQYPIAGKAIPVTYDAKFTIKDLNKEISEDIIIKVIGNINDQRCALDLEQELDTPYYAEIDRNEKTLIGNCELLYLLGKKTGIIEGYEANFITEFSDTKKVTIKMFLLEQLYENSMVIDSAEIEENEKGNPKGFWAKLFKL